MTSAAIAPAARDSLSYQDALLDIVSRARDGDTEALAYVFDHVFYDVYHHVFLVTRARQEAERATRRALDRLPAMLRSNHYRTLSDLRDALVHQARQSIRPRREVEPATGQTEGLRAAIRHVVLMATTSIAAVGAVILVI